MKKIELDQMEVARINFVKNRDGEEAALAFVSQTMVQYKRALKQRNENGYRCGYGLSFRRELIQSCIVFRDYLRNHG